MYNIAASAQNPASPRSLGPTGHGPWRGVPLRFRRIRNGTERGGSARPARFAGDRRKP